MDNFDSPEAEKVAMCRRICKDLSNILYNKAMELSLLCFLTPITKLRRKTAPWGVVFSLVFSNQNIIKNSIVSLSTVSRMLPSPGFFKTLF